MVLPQPDGLIGVQESLGLSFACSARSPENCWLCERLPYHRKGATESAPPQTSVICVKFVSVQTVPLLRVPQTPGMCAGIRTRPKTRTSYMSVLNSWRRGRDSNPRYGCPYSAFRVRRDRPLCHLSVVARANSPVGRPLCIQRRRAKQGCGTGRSYRSLERSRPPAAGVRSAMACEHPRGALRSRRVSPPPGGGLRARDAPDRHSRLPRRGSPPSHCARRAAV